MADNSGSWDDEDSNPAGSVEGPLSRTPKFEFELQAQKSQPSRSEGSGSGKAAITIPRTIETFVETEEEVCEAFVI